MGFWRRLLGTETKGDAMSSLDLFRAIYGGRESRAGVEVNWQRAIEVSTVLACVRVISNGVAQVPWRLYQSEGRNRRIASEHPLARRIFLEPAERLSSYELRETLMYHVLLTGNAFVFVNRVGSARKVRELLPIEPGRVTVRQNEDRSLTYTVRGDREQREFPPDAIWHLRGPSWNSWIGMDAVKLAREAIGLTITLEQGQADFQRHGAKTSGLYSVKSKLSPEKYTQLRDWFERELAGDGAYRPLILDDDASYAPLTMTGVDQQLIETRKHQIEEICRGFGVMPIMIAHADKTATYASAEQMFLAHVVHTLDPWYQRIEQSANINLLTDQEREDGYYTKFSPNALMRGAAKDRAEFYAKALGSGGTKGWMRQNEVRGLEDLDLDDDPEADRLPQPAASSGPAAPDDED